MAQLREHFWVVKSGNCIRNVLRKRVRCKCFQISRVEIEPETLSEDKIREAVVGVDPGGPRLPSDGLSGVVHLCCL